MVLSLHCGTRVNPNRCAVNLLQEVPKKRTEEGFVEEAFRANFEHCDSDRPLLEKEQRRTSRSIRRDITVGISTPRDEVRLSFDWHVQHTETVRRRTVRRCFRFWVARNKKVTHHIIGLLKQVKPSMSTEWIERKMRPIMGGLVAKN